MNNSFVSKDVAVEVAVVFAKAPYSWKFGRTRTCVNFRPVSSCCFPTSISRSPKLPPVFL